MSLLQKKMALFNKGPAGDVVTLSGEVVLAFSFNADATAEVFLNTDGTADSRINLGSLTQIDAATDWVIPNGSAPGLYQARYTNRSGSILSSATASEDTWSAFSGGFYTIRNFDNTVFLGGPDTTVDLQVRLSTGAVLATGSYRVNADREDL
jgi:hypothetical protein